MNSPIPTLRTIAEETICVANVVSSPLWCLPPDLSAKEAFATLRARDFDVAGLAEDPISSFVDVKELRDAEGSARDLGRPILASQCVEKSLPLADLIELLKSREHVFVLDHDCVKWLVTRADLQAPAVGMIVLAYLVAIESGLAPLVTDALGESWFSQLGQKRKRKAEEIYDRKVKNNAALGYEECLYFGDWLFLAKRSPELLSSLGFHSANAFGRATDSFGLLRNDLAHGGTVIDEVDPVRAIDRFTRIRTFAERVWQLVDTRHERWAVYASTTITDPASNLVLAGPDADDLQYPVPVHVLTAWNPSSVTRSLEVNRSSNQQLEKVFSDLDLSYAPVTGSSPDGSWTEESFVVAGLNRPRAAELGERFGQLGVFEITSDEVHVIRCSDGESMRTVARRADREL